MGTAKDTAMAMCQMRFLSTDFGSFRLGLASISFDQTVDILCDHIQLRTGLTAIMQLIAKLWIIYVSLHSRVGLSEYQLSLPLHSAVAHSNSLAYCLH